MDQNNPALSRFTIPDSRREAFSAAINFHLGRAIDHSQVIDTAKAFEAYLNGEDVAEKG